MTYVLLWSFEVEPARAAAFEAAYAADGAWAGLFARGDGFLGTTLLKPAAGGRRYLTIDRWSSAAAFAAFKRRFGEEYAALDREFDGLALEETPIGAFEEAAT